MSYIAERIANLSPAKLELLAKRLRKPDAAPTHLSIPRRTDSQTLPLSFAQQRLWFLDQLEPHSSFYNLTAGVRLTGELDIQALQHSFTQLLSPHETLPTNTGTRAR